MLGMIHYYKVSYCSEILEGKYLSLIMDGTMVSNPCIWCIELTDYIQRNFRWKYRTMMDIRRAWLGFDRLREEKLKNRPGMIT